MPRELRPLILWPGGASQEAETLVRAFPSHDTYVEPFVGGGSVFLAKSPVAREAIGDMDRCLIDFYVAVREGALRKCRGGFRHTHDLFLRAKKAMCDDACMYFVARRAAYDGSPDLGFGMRKKHEGDVRRFEWIFRNLEAYEKRLARVHILHASFEQTMRKFDGPRTLHFLDPPWLLKYAERAYKGGVTVTPEQVRKVCDSMQGACFVIYKDHDAVREAFCGRRGWTCRRIDSYKHGRHHGATPSLKIVAIKNARRA